MQVGDEGGDGIGNDRNGDDDLPRGMSVVKALVDVGWMGMVLMNEQALIRSIASTPPQ